MRIFRATWATTTFALLVALAMPASAQQYPSHALQLVVGYPEGGSGDIAAQLLAEKLPSFLGEPVDVVHRPGSSGAVGAESVARAAPDGYTLLVGQTPEMVINKNLGADLDYDPGTDFEPVALVFISPLALVVNVKAPYSTVDELLEAARSSQNPMSYASAGRGTAGQFAARLLRLGLENKLNQLPYEGAAAAMKAVVEGRAVFYFAPLAAAMPQVRLGKLKILPLQQEPTITSESPSNTRAVVQVSDIAAWVGIFAPRGTPGAIVNRLNHEINAVLTQPETRKRLLRDRALVSPMSADQFATFVKAESDKYVEMIEKTLCPTLVGAGCLRDNEPAH
jgi:tripartite-type tricarboxylate transporter receptor subunit TctC